MTVLVTYDDGSTLIVELSLDWKLFDLRGMVDGHILSVEILAVRL